MRSPKVLLGVLAASFLLILALSACSDSGVADGDGDDDIIHGLDVCDECKAGEACIGPVGVTEDPFCGQICENDLDCPNEGDCCQALVAGQDARKYCYPALYCDCPDCCNICNDDAPCRAEGFDHCDLSTNCCTSKTPLDGDDDQADGDTPDGDEPDGDYDPDDEYVPSNCDDFGPFLSFAEEVSFGAVVMGQTPPATREIEITNEGPETACIQYRIDQPEPEEFYIPETSGDKLEEGESACIKPGKSISVTVEYVESVVEFASNASIIVADFASMEIFLPKQTEDNSILPCTYYIDLIAEYKGDVHAYTDPEMPGSPSDPPAVVDFGDIRVGESKILPIVVGNRQLDPSDNRPLKITSWRFNDNSNRNFVLPQLPVGGVVIPQGSTYQLMVTGQPLFEGMVTNSVIIETTDAHNESFEIEVIANGVVPRICADPFPVIFGDVNLTEKEYQQIEICSCGGYELNLYDMSFVNNDDYAFELDLRDVTLPTLLPPPGEGAEGSECRTVEVACYPTLIGNMQASLEIESDASGSSLYQIPLSCTGVGPKICSYPASPIDFGPVQYDANNPPTVPPKGVQIWNCGPGQATVTGVSIRMGSDTPDGTFTLTNFQTQEPTDENPYPLTGGDNPNELNFDIIYNPPGYGEHRALIQVHANNSGITMDTFLEVKATATDCAEGTWDLNPNIAGCEYECDFVNAIDEPDMDFIDSNCDGIDGMIDQAIFVSQRDGDDSSVTGSWDAPVKTLSKAIFMASVQGKPHVYVSADTYRQRLQLSSGVSVFGGYNRGDPNVNTDPNHPRGWDRSMNYTVVVSGDSMGMVASLIGAPTKVQLLTVQAFGVDQDDNSSYGIYSHHADSLIMEYVTIEVGDGRSGQRATNEGQNGEAGSNGENGQAGREDDGSWYCSSQGRPGTGLGGVSRCGMRGGTGGYSCKSGSSGGCAGYPGQEGIGGAAGGIGFKAGSGGSGLSGDDGYQGNHGEGGAWDGAIRNGRWYANYGVAGTPGGNGGGGGGGGGGGSVGGGWFNCDDWGGTGGGGGGGGCGGEGGEGGEGGGSSFGIFLYDSSPELYHITIVTGNGGDGGAGRSGGRGGNGGNGGEGGLDYQGGMPGGYGGDGGGGGRGGSGGGGSGGSSIGMFIAGTSQPYYEDVTVTLGEKGYGGSAGAAAGNDGEDGRTYEIYPEPEL